MSIGTVCVARRYPRVPGLALHVHSYPLPSPAGVVMPIGTVCGARQVSSDARSRLACPQVPRPCGIHGCSPAMSLKFGYSYSVLTARLATPWFFIRSDGAQVSIGNARRSPSDVCRSPRTCVPSGVTAPTGHPPRPSRGMKRKWVGTSQSTRTHIFWMCFDI